MKEHVVDVTKAAGDVLSATVVVATLFQWLPNIAALFTIIWTSVRIYESATVQGWITRWRNHGDRA